MRLLVNMQKEFVFRLFLNTEKCALTWLSRFFFQLRSKGKGYKDYVLTFARVFDTISRDTVFSHYLKSAFSRKSRTST